MQLFNMYIHTHIVTQYFCVYAYACKQNAM